ncbi:hypothetical protein ASPFODRAFT_137019 [Aspergillus luchuensis CBS 106.47]|nr:hypothetical protein ASPFODRAFT_137019 [Aspergillus luchuensis CBS 106.47]GAA87708.1 hypothetical protein AKAW_05822 [Aspergillus luchuensis IFO 4308]
MQFTASWLPVMAGLPLFWVGGVSAAANGTLRLGLPEPCLRSGFAPWGHAGWIDSCTCWLCPPKTVGGSLDSLLLVSTSQGAVQFLVLTRKLPAPSHQSALVSKSFLHRLFCFHGSASAAVPAGLRFVQLRYWESFLSA